ncbi:MAG: DUF1326 domain-containing protein [Thermoplasmata archaeon]|nr:DUF1326 domain-containing protein [Thermoplasmata archaeon]
MPDAWSLKGDYFEVCNCDIACPCVFLSDPTHGNCTVLVGWHIDRGKAGKESLDGLNFALAAATPGNMITTKWEVAVYVDERATPGQRKALEPILAGQAGGPFGALAPLIGKVHGLRYTPIEYHLEGKRRSLRIKGVAEMSSEAITGAGGASVKIAGAPLLMTPEVTVAKSDKLSLSDYGWKWDRPGGNSFHSPFNFNGP